MTDPHAVEHLYVDRQLWPFFDDEVERREYSRALTTAGHNVGPYLLESWWRRGLIDNTELGRLVLHVWSAAEAPATKLAWRTWRDIFRTTGYIGELPRPTKHLTLYRGGRPRGWSWTRDLTIAREFANRPQNPTGVWQATVPPRAVMAQLTDEQHRGACEVIVNPWCLRGGATPRSTE